MGLYWPNFSLVFLIQLFLYAGVYCIRITEEFSRRSNVMWRTKTANSGNCFFSVETLFFFLPRGLSISLYTQEKLRSRGSLLHSFKVEYECVEQSKWKLKFCNVQHFLLIEGPRNWNDKNKFQEVALKKPKQRYTWLSQGLIEDEV